MLFCLLLAPPKLKSNIINENNETNNNNNNVQNTIPMENNEPNIGIFEDGDIENDFNENIPQTMMEDDINNDISNFGFQNNNNNNDNVDTLNLEDGNFDSMAENAEEHGMYVF